MCYSKVDGGYRCMPPKGLLNAYRGLPDDLYGPSTSSGAFWITNSEPLPELFEIEDAAAELRNGVDRLFLDAGEYELQVAHVGNMIARYSDSKVENFDERLREAQDLFFSYRAAHLDPSVGKGESLKLKEKVIDSNLALGYEVRCRLRETMSSILSFEEPFSVEINGDSDFASILYSASKFFPSTWNQTLQSKLHLDFVSKSKASWFNSEENKIQITEGLENFSSYPSMAAAQAAAASNQRQYETQVEMVHELSHKFESVESDIGKVCRAFVERRALLSRDYDFDKEGHVLDHFASSYIGTLYGGSTHTEVFSMGMETTFLGTNGSLIGLALPPTEGDDRVQIFRPDIEHRNLTIGILAGISPSYNNDNMGQPIQTIFGTYDPNDMILEKPVRHSNTSFDPVQ
jgi:hypothetical protein